MKCELKNQMKSFTSNRQQPQQDLRVGRTTAFAQPASAVPVQAQNVAPADNTVVTSAPISDDDGGPSDDDDQSKRSRSNKSTKSNITKKKTIESAKSW